MAFDIGAPHPRVFDPPAGLDFYVKGFVYVSADGSRMPVTNMFDIDGEPTDNPVRAISVVVLVPDDGFMAIEVRLGQIQHGFCN